MTTYRFEEVKRPFSQTGKCPVCDKSVRRSRTFSMTINPFNKNPDGSVRTRGDIWRALEAKAEAWEPDFTHPGCGEGQEP